MNCTSFEVMFLLQMLFLIECNFLAMLLRQTLHRILHRHGLLLLKLSFLFNKHYILVK